MAFLEESRLATMGFKRLGKNVLISEKASIYNADQIEIGDYSRIDDFCVVSGNVTIGRNVHFAVFCNVAGGEEGIVFEDFSGLAYGCHVFSQSDDYTGETMTNPTVPEKFKQVFKSSIVIGRHSIVGTNSLIFPGVTLAPGTAVGANSMVTKSTEAWSVYFGNPAKRIKARKQSLLELEAEYLANVREYLSTPPQ
jgi:acetyltransferase-like isoleucine patch superfamily enzyme